MHMLAQRVCERRHVARQSHLGGRVQEKLAKRGPKQRPRDSAVNKAGGTRVKITKSYHSIPLEIYF